ncbi:transposase [Porphyromonas gulae]|uniref:transposase n=1 Tax=Porphyromonas gulae TaxID=111105 RepID=UPI00068C2AB8
MYQWFFKRFNFDNLTLDFDSTVMTRYGEQQGATKGYNPSKPSRVGHHPLMAFLSDHKMVANCWLRLGNTTASNNFLAFLQDTLDKLEGKKYLFVQIVDSATRSYRSSAKAKDSLYHCSSLNLNSQV